MVNIEVSRAELVWPGKGGNDEDRRVSVLPFQVIETINESRATRISAKSPFNLPLFEAYDESEGDSFETGWSNKLIWGENLVVMRSLLSKFAGHVNLIYIDPPFATGADFSFSANVGDDEVEVTKEQSSIEEKAYRDTWSRGIASYLSMMFGRLAIMRELLAIDGVIYVHCDWRVNSYIRLMMDEIYGRDALVNEIVWRYRTFQGQTHGYFARKHDTLLIYAKSGRHTYHEQFDTEFEETIDSKRWGPFINEDHQILGARMPVHDSRFVRYLNKWIRQHGRQPGPDDVVFEVRGQPVDSVWDMKGLDPKSAERVGYATQKPLALLERVIQASSNKGDLVADFFCGSGTALVAAERAGRRWIGCDLGRFAIHTSRKRVLGIEKCKPFEILNLGKYERRYWQVATFGDDQDQDGQIALYEYLAFVLKLYGAQPVSGLAHLHGRKSGAMVHIGAVDAPVTIDEIDSALDECAQLHQKELHVLGWEWEMGLYELMVEEAERRGIKLALLQIPREVMEQQAVDRGDIQFFELAYLEVEIEKILSPSAASVRLTLKDFVIPNTELIPEDIRAMITKWSDYIDYWAVDWDFRNDTFVQGWVTYRTRQDRRLALASDAHVYVQPGTYRIVVKVIDIFGNDTSQAFDVEVPVAMPRTVVRYDKDLPEVPDRLPYLPPDAYLRKKTDEEFELVEGRRPSKTLLVNRIREAVDAWRRDGYPGASDVTLRLFEYWFDEEHLLDDQPFRFHFGQREAVETLAYLVEVRQLLDAKPLVDAFAERFQSGRLFSGIEHQTTMDGTRQIRRYIPELQSDAIQTLPPADLARLAFKMATGSGKTVVMAMVAVWSYFHRRRVPGSRLAANFLIVAPNVIVYQRLERDFASNRIFYTLPLIPPEWRGSWAVKPIMRGESAEPNPEGNLFLTNVQQLYESRDQPWAPINPVDLILGRRPSKDLASHEPSMLERLKGLKDLVVLTDEAHHVHDEDLSWYQTLFSLHRAVPNGLVLWLDFSATPKNQNGTFFPWIVCDYPLAQAVEDRIVKAPLIVHQVDRREPEKVTQETVIEAYGDWLVAAVERWREHDRTYRDLGVKPVLFIMAETTRFADAIGKWLVDTKEFGFKSNEVLVIHTDSAGEVTKKNLDVARHQAASIDEPESRVKVIVSVLMLREGWDVRNVTVVLGLRPFTAKAKILPEQAVGRGLRLMRDISPDQTQTLEVMGTDAFEDFVRELEVEGLGIPTTTTPPPPPIKISPVQEKLRYDIAIPLTKPVYTHDYAKLATLDPAALKPVFEVDAPGAYGRIKLRMEFATTETEVHRTEVEGEAVPIAQQVLSAITTKAMREAAIPTVFAELYPIVRDYVRTRCFGEAVNLDDVRVRRFLAGLQYQQVVAHYLAKEIGRLTAEKRTIEFEDRSFKLSDTRVFPWRRRHERCKKTVFNYVAAYNDFEIAFARFLDAAPDVDRFAALAEHFTRFRVDYLSERGAIKFYYPDFAAVQTLHDGAEVNWILETKGRLFENVANKDAAIRDWCDLVSAQVNASWRYMRVDQSVFERRRPKTFAALEEAVLKQHSALATLIP